MFPMFKSKSRLIHDECRHPHFASTTKHLNVMECSLDIPVISLRFAMLYQKQSHATHNFHAWKPSYKLDGELCPDLLANEAITNVDGDGYHHLKRSSTPDCYRSTESCYRTKQALCSKIAISAF